MSVEVDKLIRILIKFSSDPGDRVYCKGSSLFVDAYNAGYVDLSPPPDEDDPCYRSHYACTECGTHWVDEWSCACNDRCPTCNSEIEPYYSEDIKNE